MIIMLFGIVVCAGCTHFNGEGYPLPQDAGQVADQRDHELWGNTVSIYLQHSLWTENEAYDAGHVLMVPLHASFALDCDEWQREFSGHFHRLVDSNRADPESVVEGRLNKLHYFYLASQFIVLAEHSGKSDLIPPKLVELLYSEVESIWLKEPAWQWDRKPFDGGMRERVLWKLDTADVKRSYYRAIIDEEFFTFAIAADLRAYEKITDANNPVVTDILNTAYRVFNQEGKHQEGGGWLFQPGVSAQHPDYAYAGYTEITPDSKPKPVPNIASDTSHSHRFPLWLTSLANASDAEFYNGLKEQLEVQFMETVLVSPTNDFPSYRTTNFMDGRNGFYRFNYQTTKSGGYGPYELSGTMTLGWWAFLGTDRIRDVYDDLVRMCPMPTDVISVYVGPNTTRERHTLVEWPGFFTNGFAELIARLASKLPVHM